MEKTSKKQYFNLASQFLGSSNLSVYDDTQIKVLRTYAKHLSAFAISKDSKSFKLQLKRKLQLFSNNIATQTNRVAMLNSDSKVMHLLSDNSKCKGTVCTFVHNNLNKIAGVAPAIDKEICKVLLNEYFTDFTHLINSKDGKIKSSLLFKELANTFKMVLANAVLSLSTFEEKKVLKDNIIFKNGKYLLLDEGSNTFQIINDVDAFVTKRVCTKKFVARDIATKRKIVKDYLSNL